MRSIMLAPTTPPLQKLPPSLRLTLANSIHDNPYSPALDHQVFHRDTRKLLNVPRGNFLGQQDISSRSQVFSYLVSPGEFPEADANELRKILKIFEESLTHNPDPCAFDCLVYVALLSRKYHAKRWESWATTGIKNFVYCPDFPLLDISPSPTFVRLLRFATLSGEKQLQYEIQGRWIARLDSNNLPPIPAILAADELFNRELLSHALYAYLVQVEPRISNSERLDIRSPLNHQLNLRVFSGHYALQAYWKDLCDNPLQFQQAEDCTAHTDCLITWRPSWSTVVSRQPPKVSHIDVLSRLCFVEELLRADPVCRAYMGERCREAALGAVLQKRNNLILNMHHIFDL